MTRFLWSTFHPGTVNQEPLVVLLNGFWARIRPKNHDRFLQRNTFHHLSKGVRNTISEVKADKNKIVYSDIFPGVEIKRGDGAMNMWSLTTGYNNYLATSPTGTATGFGASIMIIDDLIKSAMEANNANTLEQHWTWFTDTMLSRLEEGGKIIIVMTRWHSLDLAGRIIDHYKSKGQPAKTVIYKAVQDDGSMLCPEILSKESYEEKPN